MHAAIKSAFEKKQFTTRVILKLTFSDALFLSAFYLDWFLEAVSYCGLTQRHWRGGWEGAQTHYLEKASLAFPAFFLFSILKAKRERNYTDHLKQQKGKYGKSVILLTMADTNYFLFLIPEKPPVLLTPGLRMSGTDIQLLRSWQTHLLSR